MPGGRPTTYTIEMADQMCEELAQGKSLRTVCAPDERPAISTFFKWLREHPEFSKQYAQAKEEAADMMTEDILDIADDGSNDYVEVVQKNGEVKTVLNKEHVMRSRLRVDSRKWLASKLKPKKYGDKLDVEHAGSISIVFDESLKQTDSKQEKES